LNSANHRNITKKYLSPPFRFSTSSNAHEEHPERNEDYIIIDRQCGLAVICDGVGSALGADQAARLAAKTIKSRWQQIFPQLIEQSGSDEMPELTTTLHQWLEEANQAVTTLGEQMAKEQQKPEEEIDYAETTIAAALFYRYPDRYALIYAHVGDSRIYLLREHEPLRRLTIDDGYFLLLTDKGIINEQDVLRIDQAVSVEQLSEQEQAYFEKRNGITQALGSAEISIHLGQIDLRSGDRVLLCTDGIHDNLTDAEIEETIHKGVGTRAARRLVQHSITRSHDEKTTSLRPKQDDMSAIVVTCLFPPETSAE
jgi:PPM family protein phosphatase